MTVLVERGATMGMTPSSAPPPVAVDPAMQEGPKWFIFMDSNRDQEVSLREFPGSRKKFAELDHDDDGFISVAEATESEATESETVADKGEE